jgi:hypothetical protein
MLGPVRLFLPFTGPFESRVGLSEVIFLTPWPLAPGFQSSQAFLLSLQHTDSFLCVTRMGSNPQGWESWATCSVHRHVFGCRNADMVDCRGVRLKIYDSRHRKSLQQGLMNPSGSVPVYGCGTNQDLTPVCPKKCRLWIPESHSCAAEESIGVKILAIRLSIPRMIRWFMFLEVQKVTRYEH